jgi:hypothetical protein
MTRDYSIFLWLMKLGTLVNIYFIVNTLLLASGADLYVVLPAQILFLVSAYRCLFPVRYEHNVVFHDSLFSSIFLTRLFATLSEIAYIFLFSHVLRVLNVNEVGWIDILSWLMVAQVVVSQCFVWTAILTEKFEFYFYEELGWGFIFAANTLASVYLYLSAGTRGSREVLLILNLLFGILYLPWQSIHLTSLRAEARKNRTKVRADLQSPGTILMNGLRRAVHVKNRRADAESWGGVIGLTWMTAYWATLIPMWTYYIVTALAPR